MKDYINDVLYNLVPDERRELMVEAVASLEALNFQAALDEMQQVCEMQSGIADNAMLLGRLNDIIYMAQESTFETHRVVIGKQAELAERQAIIRTITDFDSYIIPEQIDLLMGGQFTPEEIIGHMVPMFNRMKFDEIIDHIEEVDPLLIEAIQAVLVTKLAPRQLPDVEPAPVSKIRLINRMVGRFGKPQFSMMFELADSGVRVGVDFDDIYSMSIEGFDRLEPQAVVPELFGLMLFTNVERDQIQPRCLAVIDDLYDDYQIADPLKKQFEPYFAALQEFNDETA